MEGHIGCITSLLLLWQIWDIKYLPENPEESNDGLIRDLRYPVSPILCKASRNEDLSRQYEGLIQEDYNLIVETVQLVQRLLPDWIKSREAAIEQIEKELFPVSLNILRVCGELEKSA